MAKIVFGAAASHSPQVSSPPKHWKSQGQVDRNRALLVGPDGERRSFDELAALPQPFDPIDLEPHVWDEKHERVQAAVSELERLMAQASPDVVLVIGDDQNEMFDGPAHPTFAIFSGSSVDDYPLTEEQFAKLPDITKAAAWARHAEESESYEVEVGLAEHLISSLGEFDVEKVAEQSEGRSIGHAYTFVRLRLQPGSNPSKMIPIFVNCLYEPNMPDPRECIAFGRALRQAVESWPSDARVAVVASGGLSHFVVDEVTDRRVLSALEDNALDRIADLDQKHLQSGSGETRNWLIAGGALEGLEMNTVEYVPGYRSEAGTGVGMGFAAWMSNQ